MKFELSGMSQFVIQDPEAAPVHWNGHAALRLNGLLVVPELELSEGSIEVSVGADDVSYCGIVFRLRDDGEITLNFGFSDEILIRIDGSEVYRGENKFKAWPDWHDAGYVALNNEVSLPLQAGEHRVDIVLRRTEF